MSEEKHHDAASVDVQNMTELFSRMQTREDQPLDIEVLTADINQVYQTVIKPFTGIGPPRGDCKSATSANAARTNAVELIKKEELYLALLSLNRAISLAPDGSEELACAYADRSSVLFRLDEYDACLVDVNRAVKENCPDGYKKKLRERKRKCLIARRKFNDETDDEIEQLGSDATDPYEFKSGRPGGHWKKAYPLNKNNLLPNASTGIKLKYDDVWGRHMVATRNIGVGEILSYEEFYVTQLKGPFRYTHCSYCLSVSHSLIPCPSCAQAMYCSRSCRTNAFESYHRIECQFILFYDDKVLDPREQVAMRTFLRGTGQSVDGVLELMKTIKSPNNIFQENVDPTNKKLVAGDYVSILRLFNKFTDKVGLMKTYVLSVVEALILLMRVKFFNHDSMPERLGDVELFAALLMLNNIISVGTNNHAVVEMNRKPGFGGPLCERQIGAGICAIHNMINHSCDANAHTFVQNRQQVLYATRPIKEGEQVFISYYQFYAYAPVEKRIKKLWVHGFICECKACTCDWPEMYALNYVGVSFKTKNLPQFARLVKKMAQAALSVGFETLNKIEIRAVVINFVNLLYDNIEPPCFEIVLCEELLIKVTTLSYSDHHRFYYDEGLVSSGYIETTLQLITDRFSKYEHLF